MQILKKLYLSRREVSKLLDVSMTALQTWYKYPHICMPGFPKATKISKRVYRYEAKEVYKFMAENRCKGKFEKMEKDLIVEVPITPTPEGNPALMADAVAEVKDIPLDVPCGTIEHKQPETPKESTVSEEKPLCSQPQDFKTKSFVGVDFGTDPPTIVDVIEQIPIPPKVEKPTKMPNISEKDFSLDVEETFKLIQEAKKQIAEEKKDPFSAINSVLSTDPSDKEKRLRDQEIALDILDFEK